MIIPYLTKKITYTPLVTTLRLLLILAFWNGQFLADTNFSDFIFTITHKSVKKQHDDDNDHD